MSRSHRYRAGDVVTVFQMHRKRGLEIEGRATIRQRVDDADEQYVVVFANEPGETYKRFVDAWGQDDPEKYVEEFNRKVMRHER